MNHKQMERWFYLESYIIFIKRLLLDEMFFPYLNQIITLIKEFIYKLIIYFDTWSLYLQKVKDT